MKRLMDKWDLVGRTWLIIGVCLVLTALVAFLLPVRMRAVEMTEVRLRRLLSENNSKARVLTGLLESPARFVSANVISRSFMLACICALSAHLFSLCCKNALIKLFYVDRAGCGILRHHGG